MKKLLLLVLFVAGIGFASNAQSDTDTLFYLSPNPVETDAVSCHVNYPQKDIRGIRIYDIIGKEVAYIDLTGKTGLLVFPIDVSALRPGIYFCNLYSSKGIIESRKIIKK